MNGDHARTQSKHRATANVAGSHSTLSGVWPDFGRCPDFGRKPDIAIARLCTFFDPTFADAQESHQRPRNHTHLVARGDRRIGDLERLRRGLHHDPARGPRRDQLGQLARRNLPLLDDRPIGLMDADLGCLAPRSMATWFMAGFLSMRFERVTV
jgi:hypothetical protein